MYKKLEKIAYGHLLIILYWGFLFKYDLMTKEAPTLNAVSMFLLLTIYAFIYTEISNKKIPRTHEALFLIASLLPVCLILLDKMSFKLIPALISLASTGMFIKKFIVLRSAKNINILPISRSWTQRFVIAMIVFTFMLIYLFDIDQVMVHIFNQLIFLVIEFFFIYFIKERDSSYEKTYKLYYLSDYLAGERDEFARIIHDDIIQDIFAAKNYLSLKDPDIDGSKKILSNLEEKLRRLMKFYQSNLFEMASMDTSIDNIIQNASSLHGNKDIKIEKTIKFDDGMENRKDIMRLISIISNELINNIYKHSQATYISYKAWEEGENIHIQIESDGVNFDDYKRISESKRGVYLLKLLVESNAGSIVYEFEEGILTTRLVLGDGANEAYFIR